jgi:cell division protein FtsZ
MIMPGLINLDFADIRTVMSEMGKAMMGTGEASGDRRALEAAEKAIANPLLDEVSMRGAKGVIINITGGPDLTLMEVDEAATYIRDMVDPDANIIVGSAFNKDLEGVMRVSVVATGIDAAARPEPARTPPPRARVEAPMPAQPSIFSTPPAIASSPRAAETLSPDVPEPYAAAPDADAHMAEPQIAVPPAFDEEDEIDLGAAGEVIGEDTRSETYSFTPKVMPIAPAAPVAAAPLPTPEPEAETRTPTLFEKMLGLSSSHRPKPAPAPTSLAPEPEGHEPDVEIPPFFKRQVNN